MARKISKQPRKHQINALKRLDDLILVEQFGLERFIEGLPHSKDRIHAQKGFERVKAVLKTNDYDLLVLDEVNEALKYDLFSRSDFLAAIRNQTTEVTVVITGWGAHPNIIALVDDVFEMKVLKHYFHEGMPDRICI